MDVLRGLVPVPLIEELLGIALERGGDFAEIFAERSFANVASLEERRIRKASYGISVGVGIRVIVGDEVGYAYSDDLDPTALRESARVAANIARAGGSPKPVKVSKVKTPDRYALDALPDTVGPETKVALLQRGDVTAHGYDKRVLQVTGSFIDRTTEMIVATSEGVLAEDVRPMCRMNFSVVADDNGERRVGFYGSGGRVGVDHYDATTPEDLAKEAARMAVAQIGAVDAPAGPQTVVMSPGWSGVLLHEAVGHGLEADFIKKGTSLFAGQVGEKVASDLVTVVDSPEPPHKRGSLNVDDEGVVAKENVLIEKGVLKGFMSDRLSSQAMNMPSSGSGRRESYKHAPMPRMTNTYMMGGPHKHEEILESVDKGLYCAAMGGGQVDISNGNFVFEVRECYLIEDGKLTAPVKNATLIGVGPEALKNVSMVADNPDLDPGIGTCGKDGQSVPVGVGMPTVRMDNITVGGTHVG